MIVEFSVSNYRSFRDRQTLSLEASERYVDSRQPLLRVNVPGMSDSHVVKGAAIYGSNASGKSNLLKALGFMGSFVTNSAQLMPGQPTGVMPFMLDHESRTRPSEFEVYFIVEGRLYQYGFAVTPQEVCEEYLYAYVTSKKQKWFHRRHIDGQDVWETGREFGLDKAVKAKVRNNSLLLSVGPQFNDQRLSPLYRWFSSVLTFTDLMNPAMAGPMFTADRILSGDPEMRKSILELLSLADLGVQDTDVTRQEFAASDLPLQLLPPAVRQEIEKAGSVAGFSITMRHRGRDGELFPLAYEEESDGTKRFFEIIGPIVQAMHNGSVLLLDELEIRLHPLLVEAVIGLFLGERNVRGAQVIVTTHNPMLMDSGLLRRDQVWFTERDEAGASTLVPLSDYSPRKDKSLTRDYLSGRYGAVPDIRLGWHN